MLSVKRNQGGYCHEEPRLCCFKTCLEQRCLCHVAVMRCNLPGFWSARILGKLEELRIYSFDFWLRRLLQEEAVYCSVPTPCYCLAAINALNADLPRLSLKKFAVIVLADFQQVGAAKLSRA